MSEFNITIEGGTSKRLPTAGKYVDRDIIVTAERGDTMVGTWVFNEELDITLEGEYYVKIKKPDGDRKDFIGLTFADGVVMGLLYDTNGNYTDYYEEEFQFGLSRIISIVEEPTDAELIAWIKANARKLGYDEGYEKGYDEGYDQGYAEGSASGGDDTIVGIWIFNEVLELNDLNFYLNFVLTNVADSLPFYNIYAVGDDLYYVDEYEDYYTPYKNGAWIYPVYRTITITEEPTDAECIAWLKANARKATYENGYEDGFAEGEKAILSTYVDWVVSAASNSCIVDFYNDCDYYAHIYVGIEESVSGESYTEEFVLAPHDSYSISTEEMGWQVQGATWYANVTITKFSKDGEE